MVTRTIKMQVYFPGLSRTELEGKDGLWYALAQTQGDLMRASNWAATTLRVERARRTQDAPRQPENVELGDDADLAYRVMSGEWLPPGEPSGGVLWRRFPDRVAMGSGQ